jgi:hypothetical protein
MQYTVLCEQYLSRAVLPDPPVVRGAIVINLMCRRMPMTPCPATAQEIPLSSTAAPPAGRARQGRRSKGWVINPPPLITLTLISHISPSSSAARPSSLHLFLHIPLSQFFSSPPQHAPTEISKSKITRSSAYLIQNDPKTPVPRREQQKKKRGPPAAVSRERAGRSSALVFRLVVGMFFVEKALIHPVFPYHTVVGLYNIDSWKKKNEEKRYAQPLV